MTETDAKRYATAVVEVLRPNFPDLADPDVAGIAVDAIKRQVLNPRDSFEFIVDDPWRANWRLKSIPADRRCVRLANFHVERCGTDSEFESEVNEALRALDTSLLAAKEGD